MILPIVAYGAPVLKRVCEPIEADYPELSTLIEDMYETMYEAQGVGLAAPQIGKGIRLFIVDASPFADDEELDEAERKALEQFKHTFINAEIVKESGEEWEFEEGCLSIPDIRETVSRKPDVHIKYLDEHFEVQEMHLTGFPARVVQHEFDHIEGTLFTDHIGPFRRRMLKGKLADITLGNIKQRYRMKFPKKNRR